MHSSRWERLMAAGGAVFAVLAMGGLVLAGIGEPGPDASRAAVLAHYGDGATELKQELGAMLAGAAVFFLLPFLATLRSTLREAEGGRAALSWAGFAGGVVMAAMLLVAAAIDTAIVSTVGFFESYRLDADTPMLFDALAFWLQGFALVGGGVLAGSASVVALRTRLLPRWLAIVGLVVGVAGLFGETAMGLFVPLPALMVWLFATSIVLVRRGRRAHPAAQVTTAATEA